MVKIQYALYRIQQMPDDSKQQAETTKLKLTAL